MAKRKSGQSQPPADIYAKRRKAALAAAADKGAKGLLVTNFDDVSYLTGFSGDDSALLLAPRQAILITDGRYAEQAPKECPRVSVHVRPGPMAKAIVELANKAKVVGKLAVQAEHITVRSRDALEKELGRRKVLALADIVTNLRQVKHATEIAAIRKAVKVAQEAMLSMIRQGASAFVGRTERQIAADLDYRMRLAGADRTSFDTIVAVGAHGSLPHYRPDNTKVRPGQPVLIDWGASVGGYVSDLTRVVFTGRIPAKVAEIYQVVLRAQHAGIAAIGDGVAARDVDAAARDVIASAGQGERFVHSLGHGIGKVVHELPALSRLSSTVLRKGMVVTVEPGIYIPGVAGVRIEDDVEVAASGGKRVSSLSTEMRDWIVS